MPRRRLRRASVVLVLLAGTAAPASAGQDPQLPGTSSPAGQSVPAPDFLLGPPAGSIGLRSSWLMARAGSDIYDFVTDQLTLSKSSFNGPAFGGEVTVLVSPRVELVGGFELSTPSSESEYRRYIDNKGLPIQQSTSLRTVHVTGSGKLSLLPRGRRISRYAWIPRTVTPYVGAGAGATYYRFTQAGDFVDYQDLHVFSDVFESRGWAPNAHAFAGLDVQAYRRLFVSFEGRYLWSAARLGRDFVGFAPMDLSGVRLGGGVHVAF